MAHVAFLRGINVGGHTVKGPRLVELFTEIGLENARTFLASGNVLFETDDDASTVESRVEEALREGLGYAVPTFVRSGEEVAAVASREPFPDRAGTGKFHVAFLRAPLDRATRHKVLTFTKAGDAVVFDGRQLYWHVAGGFAESGLGDPALSRLLRDAWTVRTLNTVQRLAGQL